MLKEYYSNTIINQIFRIINEKTEHSNSSQLYFVYIERYIPTCNAQARERERERKKESKRSVEERDRKKESGDVDSFAFALAGDDAEAVVNNFSSPWLWIFFFSSPSSFLRHQEPC